MFDRDRALVEKAHAEETESIIDYLKEDGLIPGGSKLYHPDEPEEYAEDENTYPERDPEDYRDVVEESDHIAPGARFG